MNESLMKSEGENMVWEALKEDFREGKDDIQISAWFTGRMLLPGMSGDEVDYLSEETSTAVQIQLGESAPPDLI